MAATSLGSQWVRLAISRMVRKLAMHGERWFGVRLGGDNGFLNTQRVIDPFRFMLIAVSGWMNQRQLRVIEYLREENRVLREQLGGRRVRLNDNQRRRLAVKAKVLGRKVLAEVGGIVTPETLLAWYRRLIAQKVRWNCPSCTGRPRTADEIEALVVRMAEENRDCRVRESLEEEELMTR
jgi:hypothetical protein